VSVFVFCGGKLRLAILGALPATILMRIADFGVQTLSAPFVFTTWLMLGLGWVEDNWFDVEPERASEPGSKPDVPPRVAHGQGSFVIHPPGTRHSRGRVGGCIALLIYEKAVRFVEPQ
jgi:hypothetical protein